MGATTTPWSTSASEIAALIFQLPLVEHLFRDLDFWQRYIDRYQELRHLFSVIRLRML